MFSYSHASPENPIEEAIFKGSAAVFVPNGKGGWDSADGGISAIAVYKHVTGPKNVQFRVVTLSLNQQYLVNSWLSSQSRVQAGSDQFCTLTLPEDNETYALTFQEAAEMAQFIQAMNSAAEYFKKAAFSSSSTSLTEHSPEYSKARAMQEIFTSEESYVRYLNILVKLYLEPLRNTRPLILPLETIKLIFSDIEVILSINTKLLQELDQVINHTSLQLVGTVFVSHKDYLKVYSTYINGYEKAVDTLEKCKKTVPNFKKFLEETRAKHSAELGGRNLDDFLIMPVQRIPRYVILLQELGKHQTKVQTQDTFDIPIAIAKMKEIASLINDRRGEEASFQEVVAIYKKLEPQLHHELAEAHRRKIREGPLKVVMQRNGQKKKRHVFLFNDIMLVTKPELGKYWMRIHITLKTVSKISNVALKGQVQQNAFGVHAPTASVVFFAKDEEERDLWVKDLRKLLNEIKEQEEKMKRWQEDKLFHL